MIFETGLSTLNISRAKRKKKATVRTLWLDFFVPPKAAEGTGNGWIGCPCSKALSKDSCEVEGCESWENICELKGENKPSTC